MHRCPHQHPSSWASLADCLAMIREKHPAIAREVVYALHWPTTGNPTVWSAPSTAWDLTCVQGFGPLMGGIGGRFQTAFPKRICTWLPKAWRCSVWQITRKPLFDRWSLPILWSRLDLSFSECSCCAVSASYSPRVLSILMATIELRVRELVRWLGKRGFAVERSATRICRDTTNVMLRDMDLAIPRAHDGRRLEFATLAEHHLHKTPLCLHCAATGALCVAC